MIILPFLSFIGCGALGRKLGYEGVKLFSSGILLLNCIISMIIFNEVIILESNLNIISWAWFDSGFINTKLIVRLDLIVCSMLVLVSLVSFFVHIFSTSYMDGDPHLPRFISYLSLFTFFMMILITSNSLVQLFIGWEGVGLCSYLLIGFWFTRVQANKSAIKAMIVNKIGDIGLLLGIILIWIIIGSFDFSSVFCNSPLIVEEGKNLDLISFLLLIGVIGKSAQIGLHTWLPDAMEGPTPVSALIHAATMVTAGVFLIIRMSPLFESTPTILLLVVLVGSITAFFASTIGLIQNDLKKVIAYSTCSQLGYMVIICGFSQYSAGLFHLINHGFFKALLFLSAGSIIHALSDEQDFRKMGGFNSITPFTYACIVIGSVSLMGLPFLTGFYSKDLIIELIYGSFFLRFALWLGVLSAFITAFYSFRLIHLTFFNSPQSSLKYFSKSHEGNWNLKLPLVCLLILSLIFGYYTKIFILGDGLPIIITNISKFIPLIVSLLGSTIALSLGIFIVGRWKIFEWVNIKRSHSFLSGAWYVDSITNQSLSKWFMNFGFSISYRLIDNQILEYLGPTSVNNKIALISGKSSHLHSGKLTIYIVLLVSWFFVILFK